MKYITKINIVHILLIAIPLLIIGLRGLLGSDTTKFEYTVLFLLGGMALIYHLFWLIYNWTKDFNFDYFRVINLVHIFFIALPLLYFGYLGRTGRSLSNFPYIYIIILAVGALIFHSYRVNREVAFF